MSKHIRGRFIFNVLVILTLVLLAATPSFAQDSGPKFEATPLSPESTIVGSKDAKLVGVIVKLEGESLASYAGGIAGLAPTNPAVTGETELNIESSAGQAYLAHLARQQAAFEAAAIRAIPQAKVTYRYDVVLNGLAMRVPADQVDTLAKLPGVEAVYPDALLHLDMDTSPGFVGASDMWTDLGGAESSGDDVVVGVLDTGIWPEHPSFSDPDPSGKAYGTPPPPLSGTRQCNFTSGANPGPAFTCNNKLIGAYRFMSTYEANATLLADEYTSARDDDGHGTHTSSTAAGNAGVEASILGVDRGIISGITPRARVIMYKVCGANGCYDSDSAAAVQQAILDGVNAINFSISGGSTPFSDAVELAFRDAYSAGVFVAASTGNSGPSSDTTDHRGPWTTTVAASTHSRVFQTTATVTASGASPLTLVGTSLTAGIPAATGMVLPADDPRCLGPYAAGTFTGKVVICRRGTTGRAEKGYEVLQGGAAGMILYNQSKAVTDVETDNHWLPAIHIQYDQGQELLDFLADHPGATVTWPDGAKATVSGDVMASFSSRGGPGQTLGVSKPDITAPGVQILAGHSPEHMAPPAGVALGPQGELFQAIAGTSMSSPHIAGAGALVKALHPDWTPGQIKSALMTTAWTEVLKEDGETPADAFDYGSGRLDLSKAGDPGLSFSSTALEYTAHQDDLWNANYPSVYVPTMAGSITVQRTAHSVLDANSDWDLEVRDQSADDFTVTVPASISVPAGGDTPFNIVIDGRDVPVGEVRMAKVHLTDGSRELHIPVTFVRAPAVVTLEKTCSPDPVLLNGTTSCTITAANYSFSEATVEITDQLPAGLKLVPGSVTGGTAAGNGVTAFATLDPAVPPDVAIVDGTGTSPGGYLPLSGFGYLPISDVDDETITNYDVPAFTYAGETYTMIGVVSNGYAVVGGGTGADIQYINQSLPDAAAPNNVLAPFWTDLDPGEAGAMYAGILTDGVNDWLILEWAGVPEWGTPANLHSFQIWIGLDGNTPAGQDITFTYGDNTGTGTGGLATVGAENRYGNSGGNWYYNGTGTLPVAGTELRVTASAPTPDGSQVITYDAKGVAFGAWVNYANMTGTLFAGTSIASDTVSVVPLAKLYLPIIAR
jgi:uncharacterized repeat protein (TIGR01451 family)